MKNLKLKDVSSKTVYGMVDVTWFATFSKVSGKKRKECFTKLFELLTTEEPEDYTFVREV